MVRAELQKLDKTELIEKYLALKGVFEVLLKQIKLENPQKSWNYETCEHTDNLSPTRNVEKT